MKDKPIGFWISMNRPRKPKTGKDETVSLMPGYQMQIDDQIVILNNPEFKVIWPRNIYVKPIYKKKK